MKSRPSTAAIRAAMEGVEPPPKRMQHSIVFEVRIQALSSDAFSDEMQTLFKSQLAASLGVTPGQHRGSTSTAAELAKQSIRIESFEPGAGDARHLVLGLTAGADEECGVLGADEHLHRGVLSRLLCAGKGVGTISYCLESG